MRDREDAIIHNQVTLYKRRKLNVSQELVSTYEQLLERVAQFNDLIYSCIPSIYKNELRVELSLFCDEVEYDEREKEYLYTESNVLTYLPIVSVTTDPQEARLLKARFYNDFLDMGHESFVINYGLDDDVDTHEAIKDLAKSLREREELSKEFSLESFAPGTQLDVEVSNKPKRKRL